MNNLRLHVPRAVVDIDSFRRWTDTPDFPEIGDIWWLCGEIWVDLSPEEIFTHNQARAEIGRVIYNLVKPESAGHFFPRGGLFSNHIADISGKPDALFVSESTVQAGRFIFVRDERGGCSEFQGSPDMVLEITSDSSVRKDHVVLLEAYWRAGISEYWLVDARSDKPVFDIFRHSPKEYKRSPKKHGWLTSSVFGKSFRLTTTIGPAGQPKFTLEVR